MQLPTLLPPPPVAEGGAGPARTGAGSVGGPTVAPTGFGLLLEGLVLAAAPGGDGAWKPADGLPLEPAPDASGLPAAPQVVAGMVQPPVILPSPLPSSPLAPAAVPGLPSAAPGAAAGPPAVAGGEGAAVPFIPPAGAVLPDVVDGAATGPDTPLPATPAEPVPASAAGMPAVPAPGAASAVAAGPGPGRPVRPPASPVFSHPVSVGTPGRADSRADTRAGGAGGTMPAAALPASPPATAGPTPATGGAGATVAETQGGQMPAGPLSAVPSPADGAIMPAVAGGIPVPAGGRAVAGGATVTGPRPAGSAVVPGAQLAGRIEQAVADGQRTLRVQLDPEHLGRVEVRLEIQDGRVSAMIAAERPATLDLLLRDARLIERALQQGGMQVQPDGLHFSLREGGEKWTQAEQGWRGARSYGRDRQGEPAVDPLMPQPVTRSDSIIDIQI